MKKTIAILITLLVLAISTATPKTKADDELLPEGGGCSSGTNISGNCFSQWYCVMINGALYMQYQVCCSGNCFIYLEPVVK